MELETVWTGNNFDNAIKSNVDYQDEPSIDDFGDIKNIDSEVGDILSGSVKNLVSSVGVISSVKNLTDNFKEKKQTEIPKGTVRDNKFDDWLVKSKSKNFKNVKLSSKQGTFAGIDDLIKVSCGFMVGALGKSATANFIDEMAIKFAGGIDNKAVQFTAGLGIAGIAEKLSVDNIQEKLPTMEELAQLTLANYYNIYENKPGRIVRDRYNKYNYITMNTKDGIDGSIDGEGSAIDLILKGLKNAGNTVSKTMGMINKYGISMTGITDLLHSEDRREGEDAKILSNRTLIISTQKESHETYIGEKIVNVDGAILNNNISPWNWSEKHSDRIDASKVYNRVNTTYRKIGSLYIEPYWTNGTVNCFNIPFQFNPNISGDSLEAKYNTEELMGRILSIRSYVGSDAGTLSLETEYLALTDDKKTDENNYDDPFKTDQWVNGWMADWSVAKLEAIERAYRSLTLPYIDYKKNIFVKPPIVRIKMGSENNVTVGDLFKYPVSDGKECLKVTSSLSDFTREKRYIVTNLEISQINDESWGINYVAESDKNDKNSWGYRRRGFKVRLSLAETTKNFLDIVPNFKQYYEYYSGNDGTYNIANGYLNKDSPKVEKDNGNLKSTLEKTILKIEVSENEKDSAYSDNINIINTPEDLNFLGFLFQYKNFKNSLLKQ